MTIRIPKQQLPSRKSDRYYKDLKLSQLESKLNSTVRLSLNREITRKSCLVL